MALKYRGLKFAPKIKTKTVIFAHRLLLSGTKEGAEYGI